MFETIINVLIICASVLISVGISIFYMKKAVESSFNQLNSNLKELPRVQQMDEMRQKSIDSRQQKALERKIANDLLNVNAPEIKAILQYFSPDTLKYIEDNPQVAMAVIQRFKPLLDQFMGAGQKKDDTEGGLIF